MYSLYRVLDSGWNQREPEGALHPACVGSRTHSHCDDGHYGHEQSVNQDKVHDY